MDVLVRYWSESSKEIEYRYLTSLVFGHATADHMVQALLQTIQEHGLPLSKLCTLSSDGSNVKKAVTYWGRCMKN